MAEAIVEIVLEQFVSIIDQQAEGIMLIAGAEQEFEKLQHKFMSIKAVLVDAENRQVKDYAVRHWLAKVKDVSYEMNDVLDEWSTKLHQLRIKKAEQASKPLKKVRSLSFHYLCCKPLILRYNIAVKIKKLDEKLDIITMETQSFKFTSVAEGAREVERPMTTSFIELGQVYGRDYEKNAILDLLLSQSNQQKVLPIISIVGMGGLGKTILFQLVFNSDKVNTHFDKKIWVCVSKNFDEVRIAKAILESLTNNAPNLYELQTVMQNIRQHIERQKFLLVLDDVWTENSEDWDHLKDIFQCGSLESRILVTTRKEKVANVIGTTKMITLGKLADEDCWLLFRQIAFSQKSIEESIELELIGRKIVQKCQGLPLAVRILAGLLRYKREVEEWQNILCSEIWELEAVEQDLFRPLLLSYNDLHPVLKKCFSYCAIFPKDYEIKIEELIRLWMAQGYVKSRSNTVLELVGEEYFKTLVRCSFFEEFQKYENYIKIRSCKMHDSIRAFALSVSENECYTMEVKSVGEFDELPSSYGNVRHLMIKIEEGASFPSFIYTSCPYLRSLVVDCDYSDPKIVLSKLVDQFRYLRSLSLCQCSVEEVPIEINELRKLRYLNLSHNLRLEKLPESLCELYYLQTLDVTNCYRLQKLPQGLGKLVNLRYLRNHGTPLSYMPRGIERLTHLQQLSKFVVSDDGRSCSLARLENLKELGGFLMITGLGNVRDVGEVKKTKLEEKKNLCALCLRFDGWMFAEDEGIFEDLQPPPNLQELMIQYYTGRTMPLDWILLLSKLRVLKLSSCFEFEDLPALGKLPTLESLMIWNMLNVRKVGDKFLGIESGDKSSSSSSMFPKLKYLAMWSMEEWEEWEASDFDVASIMPCLRVLKLSSCPKLRALPSYIIRPTPRLEKVDVKNCRLLKQRYNKETGQDYSKISHIPGFLIVDASQSSTSLLTVDSEMNTAEMESGIQDKGSKGKMPMDFSTATIGIDPQTSNSV